MKRAWLALWMALGLVLGVCGVALAHAQVQHCTPEVGSTVMQPPAQVSCLMTKIVDPKSSKLSVWDAAGNQVDKGDTHPSPTDPGDQMLIVSLDPAKIKGGTYTVKWNALTPDDKGVTDGSFQFTVMAATTGGVTRPAGNGLPSRTLLIAWLLVIALISALAAGVVMWRMLR